MGAGSRALCIQRPQAQAVLRLLRALLSVEDVAKLTVVSKERYMRE
jgi:hypothetical protein